MLNFEFLNIPLTEQIQIRAIGDISIHIQKRACLFFMLFDEAVANCLYPYFGLNSINYVRLRYAIANIKVTHINSDSQALTLYELISYFSKRTLIKRFPTIVDTICCFSVYFHVLFATEPY